MSKKNSNLIWAWLTPKEAFRHRFLALPQETQEQLKLYTIAFGDGDISLSSATTDPFKILKRFLDDEELISHMFAVSPVAEEVFHFCNLMVNKWTDIVNTPVKIDVRLVPPSEFVPRNEYDQVEGSSSSTRTKFIMQSEVRREEEDKAAAMMWEVLEWFGHSSRLYREVHSGLRTKKQVMFIMIDNLEPKSIMSHMRRLVTMSNWAWEVFGSNPWTGKSGCSVDHFKLEAYFEARWEETGRPERRQTASSQEG